MIIKIHRGSGRLIRSQWYRFPVVKMMRPPVHMQRWWGQIPVLMSMRGKNPVSSRRQHIVSIHVYIRFLVQHFDVIKFFVKRFTTRSPDTGVLLWVRVSLKVQVPRVVAGVMRALWCPFVEVDTDEEGDSTSHYTSDWGCYHYDAHRTSFVVTLGTIVAEAPSWGCKKQKKMYQDIFKFPKDRPKKLLDPVSEIQGMNNPNI